MEEMGVNPIIPFLTSLEYWEMLRNKKLFCQIISLMQCIFDAVSSQAYYHPKISVICVNPIDIFLLWDPLDSVSFYYYLVSILDVISNNQKRCLLKKINITTEIEDLKSFHHYLIHVPIVTERRTLSCFEHYFSVVSKHMLSSN
jgi:hypothetical protein